MKMPTLQELEKLVQNTVKDRKPFIIEHPGFMHSAVLMPIFSENQKLKFILTKRTESLKKHRGEISFPGGRKDRRDKSLEETSLRETEEEIGVPRDKIKIIGRLDDLFTITRYIITPFIGIITEQVKCISNGREVAELLYVPMDVFLNKDKFAERNIPQNGADFPVYYYYWNNREIWGATAYIINQFMETVFNFQPSKIKFKRTDPSIIDKFLK
jgi:8-oxo-dGTP pyrophosphatase MutT (NUDIX family)